MALGTLGSTLNDELNRLANGGTYREKINMVDEALAAKQWANRENINPYSTDTVGILNEIAGLGLDKRNWLDFNGVCNYIAGTTGLPAAAALRQVYPTTDLLTSQASYYVDSLYPVGLTNTPGYVYLNGATGNYMSTPDANALDITGDIDIRIQAALDDWTPSDFPILISKRTASASQYSFYLLVLTDGKLEFGWTTNGSTSIVAASTVAPTITDGSVKWVRVTLDVDNGASGNDTKFFTSDDGITWTQLGATVTKAGTTSIYSSTAILAVGSQFVGTSGLCRGKFYRAQVRNGIDGTVVFDANMANVSQTATSFTESSSNAATVTINGFRAYPQDVTNLGAAGSLLPTTVGSSTAADSNDPKFLDHTGTNYVYLTGVAGNRLEIPDSAALDITGDIDIRAYVAADNPAATGTFTLVSKWDNTASGSSSQQYLFWLNSGSLEFYGRDATGSFNQISSVTAGLVAGVARWVRVTVDVDNGAGGYDVKFFTSTDGITYTQLGTTKTGARTVSFQDTTQPLYIGQGASSSMFTGKVFRAQIFNGIDGTKVLDVDTSVITAGSATTFAAVTGQTVTINRSTSGRKSVAVTQPTWLFGTDDFMEVNNRYMSSGTYLYLPGVVGNYASTPDSAAVSITGDIDLRAKVAFDDWTPSPLLSMLISKYGGGGARSYYFAVTSTGNLQLEWSVGGTTTIVKTSTVAPTIADGATKWVRATLDVDNGAGGNDLKFFTSDDGTTWTQLGSTITTAGTTSIFDGAANLEVGANNSGINQSRGKFFRAQVLNGIDGTVAFDANFETSITSLLQTSFTESSTNAATVTINRSGSTYRSAGITAAGYLYPGATNTFTASATDFLEFGANDSFTLMVVARQFATPVNFGRWMDKANGALTRGYTLHQNGTNFQVYSTIGDGTGTATTFASPSSTSAGSLAVVTSRLNRSASTLSVSVNAGTVSSASTSTIGSTVTSPNASLVIGKRSEAATFYNDMEFISAAVFRSSLSAAQIRQIVNYFANREVYL